MSFLRNFGGLIKRHYEKVILVFALIALIGAVWYLNEKKSEENATIEKYDKETAKRRPNLIPLQNMSELKDMMDRGSKPLGLIMSPPHNLFNPVKWQQRNDNNKTRPIKNETGKQLGIEAVQVAKISPLNLTITLESQAGSGANMSTVQEGATNRFLQTRIRSYVTTNSTSERLHRSHLFTLKDFRSTADGPEADVELADSAKTVATITVNKPFIRAEGYKADLIYPVENLSFANRRIGDSLTVAGEEYIIVAINSNEVVVSARSNDRRTTIRSTNPIP